MTTGDVISKTDALEPNQYDTDTKLGWLSQLDGKIIDQVILTHEPFGGSRRRLHWKDPFSRDESGPMEDAELHFHHGHEGEEECEHRHGPPYHGLSDEMVVEDPYGEDIYVPYLQAKIALENAETVKYNQNIAVFQSAYQEWTDRYNRTHMPAGNRGQNRFRW